MEFSHRKLSQEMLSQLHRVKIESVQPFSLMLTPVYVYLRRNQKLVSVKGPLDFFVQSELDRLRPCDSFYFSKFIESVIPFRKAGLSVREILNWKTTSLKNPEEISEATISPVPYILSDRVLRLIGPLWWDRGNGDLGIEPYLAAVFVNEVCETLPKEKLLRARDLDVQKYEDGILISSWAVFLALHLGYCDLGFLNKIRLEVFNETVFQQNVEEVDTEIKELIQFAKVTFSSASLRAIECSDFRVRSEKVAYKLVSRLERISRELASRGGRIPTIFGERGFVDA